MNSQELLTTQFKTDCTESEWQWLQQTLALDLAGRKLGFVMAHRHIARESVSGGYILISEKKYKISLAKWTRDQLARTVLLLSMDEGDQAGFHDTISALFRTSDNREAQAIYAAISLFPYEETWKFRATEAIRSNVGLIFDAMAFNNPYPAIYFDDPAWNQLVLKTIFAGKSIWQITGLQDRRNEELARAISDFAHERWAAGRTLPPEVWFLTEPFPSIQYWQDAEHLITSEEPGNRTAAYLLWKKHADAAPNSFSERFHQYFSGSKNPKVDWENLATD